MGIINILPTSISNKIAAGEVVERPASVVKELVENSIDAGSSKISVEIRNGGVTYIRVTDNGCGMTREDARVAFIRHATSKIKAEEDLDAIYTLGFRGEALSSIGAVSKVELYTKRREDDMGFCVRCDGGVIAEAEEAGTPDGTGFIVQNLFYNTPARMKFLKRDATEAAAVTDIMERFILSHPEIAFQYTVEGKEKYNTTGDGSLENCIYAVYGKNYAKASIPVDYADEMVRVSGIAGKGDTARPNRGYQSFFVNKRYIKSPLIMKAVEDAYKNQIMVGKYPMAVLNLEINPAMVDINVHPTKLEVKFSKESEIYRAVYHAVKNALYAIPNVPQIDRSRAEKTHFIGDSVKITNQEELPVQVVQKPEVEEEAEFEPKHGNGWVHEETPEKVNLKPANKPVNTYKADTSSEYFAMKQQEMNRHSVVEKRENYHAVAEEIPVSEYTNKVAKSVSEPEYMGETVEQNEEKWGFDTENIKVIGQVFDSYALAQSGDTMIIVDQHAAHERLKYEELKKELEKKQVTSQILMIPVICDLSSAEYLCYLENEKELEAMGFETETFGSNSILIRATPEALDEEELKQAILEIIDNFYNNKTSPITEKRERALYTIACKAAVKANHRLDNIQLDMLIRDVLALKNINTCPHGRPIIVTMSKKELEKEFKRII